ncbi:gliding motility-associated C-terminal domain-containing protein [Aquimarina sp. 2201CG5-10]|uniref:T9SS type B sorting domain-containing protein n=1 Tax=Aquimarina callyspongiae TaxID=3098150 RepID=UPI002AB45AF5|nr:gliding motility-associated C-terminal domain-containing protein [Aquimarina sp. 2201CG5-10]MDY8135330.1 gliding motility-associated C-terminal domain-containing protein [Aquimarina sp. 2201CG5-10]
MRNKLNLSLVAFVLCFLFSSWEANAQVILGPEFFINDSSVTATQACVNQNVPNRSAVAEYTGPAGFFGPGTTFILEISDENGVYADPAAELSRITLSVALGSTAEIIFPDFPIPTDLRGEDYSMRVRAENPAFTGNETQGIPIYYFDTNEGVTLVGPNVDANNAALCDGNAITLTASPDGFPEYIWTLNGSVIQGESGSTLTGVNQPGEYTVQVNFGSCSPFFNFDSGTIQVLDFNTTTVFIRNDFPVDGFCPSDVKVLTCSIIDSGYTYEWFQDGNAIADSDSPTILLPQSNFEGDYTVLVTASDDCSIETDPVTILNKGSNITSQPPPQMILLPTQTSITLAIATDAPLGSTVQWFRGGFPITPVQLIDAPGALSVEANQIGVYRVDVVTNDSCLDTLQAETEIFDPIGFRVEIASILDCNDDTATLGLETLYGLADGGTGTIEIPLVVEQYPFFDFEWFRDNVSTGDTGTTISITDSNDTSVYALEATLRGTTFPTVRSNEITPGILTDVIDIIASSLQLPFGGTVTLTVPNNASYTYEWFRIVDGENQLIEGETGNEIEIDQAGQYFVIITSGECVVQSNTITITDETAQSEIIPNVITPNNDGANDNWALPTAYVNQQDVEINIYNSRGQLDFSSVSYQNNWPSENSKTSGQERVYYYIITKNNSVVRKGSITVMR